VGHYPTQLGVTYSFRKPQQLKQTSTKDNASIPVYIDGKMRLYDKNYVLVTLRPPDTDIESDNSEKPKKGPFSFDSYSPNATFPEFGLLQFPDYHLFDSKEDFDNSLSEWYKKVQQFTSGIFLPNPILAKTFITSRPSIFNRRSPEFRKYNPVNDKPTPINLVFLHSKLLEGKVNLKEPLPQQITNSETVITKHQMTDTKQWQSQMLATEPLHLLYSNFEDFEAAYKKWYNVCCDNIEVPPIKPLQFVDILGIERQPQTSTAKFKPLRIKPEKNIDYSWAAKLENPKCAFSIDLIQRVEESSAGIHPDNVIVFNIDKDEFIDDMKSFGVHFAALKSEGTHIPFKHVYYEVLPEEDAKMEQFIKDIDSSINPLDLLRFLFISYDPSKFTKYLNSRSGNTLFRSIIVEKMETKYLKTLFEIAGNSDQFALRVALLLSLITTSKKAINTLKFLLEKKNINSLYQFTKLAILLSKEYLQIYPPICSTEFSYLVSQLHYASILIKLPVTQLYMPFEESILSFCRKTTKEIIQMLRKGTTIDNMWNSLKRNKLSDTSLLMEMLETIQSSSLISVLTKNNIIDCIKKVAKYPIGRRFIHRIIFSKCGRESLNIIKKCSCFNASVFTELSEVEAMTIALCINEYAQFIRKIRSFAPIQHMNTFLMRALNSYSRKLNPIIIGFVSILCSKDLVSPGDVEFCERFIANFCGQVCILATIDKTILFNDAVLIIEPCIKFDTAVEQISNNPDFCSALIREMNGTDVKYVHKVWHLFNAFASSSKILSNAFKSPEAGKALQSIATSENPLIFRKFSEFITLLADASDKSLLDFIEKQISSSVGRIACTIKNASILFSKYPKTTTCTENMCVAVLNTNGNFKQNLANHLSSLNVDWKKIAAKRQHQK
jgi:hypothetical protein